jgi:hypothetical protein
MFEIEPTLAQLLCAKVVQSWKEQWFVSMARVKPQQEVAREVGDVDWEWGRHH